MSFDSASYNRISARSRASVRSSGLRTLLAEREPRRPRWAGPFGDTESDPRDVFAGARVDLDLVAGVDEQRNLNHLVGLQRRRLTRAADAITLNAGVGVGDSELDGGRNLDGHDLAVVEGDDGHRVFNHVIGGITERDRCDVLLVVGLHVHEDVIVAIAVEELHVLLLEHGLLDANSGVEGAINNGTGAQISNFGAHEGTALAGLDMLKLDHLKQDLVEFEGDPVF